MKSSTVQSITGLGLFLFAGLHIGGHSIAPVSLRGANAALFAVREVVQHPVTEVVLFAGVTAHLGLGIANMVSRRFRGMSVFRASALILAVTVPLHMVSSRIIPSFVLTPPQQIDLAHVAHSMNDFKHHPIISSLLYPYYVVLGSAGLIHGVLGISQTFRNIKKPHDDAAPAKKNVLLSSSKQMLLTMLKWVEKNKGKFSVAAVGWMALTMLAINGWAGPIGGDRIYVSRAASSAMENLHTKTLASLSFNLL
ncbi:hypothetical protein CcCBS67573_g03187 [Chytriomyces confervae]|uniref:Mitochondrial adapter protein MCP1 transmembrane domain-containing protein n=1 Tax=Chytriomyces confervae TaxID=246404 RepID=A0A507FGL7_9FUNG|nr:hypothetical protein HDU80_006310 [Chytriomyces hyalinus]TPX75541.1 hypothetical protein CcCBS67573_g03187 [Chytriomyces confervae]